MTFCIIHATLLEFHRGPSNAKTMEVQGGHVLKCQKNHRKKMENVSIRLLRCHLSVRKTAKTAKLALAMLAKIFTVASTFILAPSTASSESTHTDLTLSSFPKGKLQNTLRRSGNATKASVDPVVSRKRGEFQMWENYPFKKPACNRQLKPIPPAGQASA